MRTEKEFKEAFQKVADAMQSFEGGEDDGELQAVYDALRWANGEVDFDNSIGMHL